VLSTRAETPRIVPRPRFRPLIAKAAHESLGHRGYRGVADALRLHYTWNDRRQSVEEAVENASKHISIVGSYETQGCTPFQQLHCLHVGQFARLDLCHVRPTETNTWR
jgi:hypothetical protein